MDDDKFFKLFILGGIATVLIFRAVVTPFFRHRNKVSNKEKLLLFKSWVKLFGLWLFIAIDIIYTCFKIVLWVDGKSSFSDYKWSEALIFAFGVIWLYLVASKKLTRKASEEIRKIRKRME